MQSTLRFIALIGDWTAFSVVAMFAALKAIVAPSTWLRPLYSVFIGGLPLACVTGLALGVVIWVHTRDVLERTGSGAVEYLPTFLAAAVLLELAPIGAGLIIAARTGASLGAELAAMRVSEQIDAINLLGVSPMARLVGPRVLVCILAAPMLHVLITMLALGSGFVAETFTGQTTWLKYQTAVLRELNLNEVLPAGLKTLVFGALVGVTGCHIGLNGRAGSEGVGQAATDSVVVCSLLVLAADILLVGLIQALLN